jgi:hypothetical protein
MKLPKHIPSIAGRKSERTISQAITAKPRDEFPTAPDYLPRRRKGHIQKPSASVIVPRDPTPDSLAPLRD